MTTFNYDPQNNESQEVPDFNYTPASEQGSDQQKEVSPRSDSRTNFSKLSNEDKLAYAKYIVFMVGAGIIIFLCYKWFPIPPYIVEGQRGFSHFTRIAICLGIAGVFVTEPCLRFFLSGISATVLTSIAFGISKLLKFSEGGGFWMCVAVAILGLVGTYSYLAESAWLGHLCSACGLRGKISKRITGKEWQGSEQRNTSTGFKTFAIYKIYHEKTCGHCGAMWSWTTESHEERS